MIENLQDRLGDLNDIAVHEQLSEELAAVEQADRDGRNGQAKRAFAAGRLSGREEARVAPVLEEAQRVYAAFIKTKPFWG